MVNRQAPDEDGPRPSPPWRSVSFTSGKRDFVLDLPWTNASGTLGFSTEAAPLIDFASLGAFITNPISLHRRMPASGPRFVYSPGGFVLHTGLPNPGLPSVVRRNRERWRAMACPVILHLISDDARELVRMLEMLETVEEVAGVEVGVRDDDPTGAAHLIGAAASRELPVLARLPFGARAIDARAALDAGAAGISFAPPRAVIPGPGGMSITGRLYGPAVFPMALETIARIRADGVDAPVMAAGGVYRRRDLNAMLAAGASAVQLDSVLWTEPEAVLAEE